MIQCGMQYCNRRNEESKRKLVNKRNEESKRKMVNKRRRENEVQEYHFKKREAHKIFGNKKILYINNIIYSK